MCDHINLMHDWRSEKRDDLLSECHGDERSGHIRSLDARISRTGGIRNARRHWHESHNSTWPRYSVAGTRGTGCCRVAAKATQGLTELPVHDNKRESSSPREHHHYRLPLKVSGVVVQSVRAEDSQSLAPDSSVPLKPAEQKEFRWMLLGAVRAGCCRGHRWAWRPFSALIRIDSSTPSNRSRLRQDRLTGP